MSRYKCWIEFEGTNYHGWQTQPEGNTVQDELERAFGQILQEEIKIHGQGRTDSGVHAEGQIAHVDIGESVDIDRLQYGVNGVLPEDIAVWRIEQVDDDFHARFDATSRVYRYQVVQRPRPLYRRTAHTVLQSINRAALDQCAGWIEGEHDFESFTKTSDEQPSAVCTVHHSVWEAAGDGLLVYRVRANRFVRHLVRRLVGTMLEVGKEKLTPEAFEKMLFNPDPENGGVSAPSKGLILEKVNYK